MLKNLPGSRKRAFVFLCFVIILFLSAGTAFAQRRLLCDNDASCGPDPSATTSAVYDRAVAARTAIINQRVGNHLVVTGRTPLTKTVLGSQSYDYSISLVSLPGRNNLNLNLNLFYNSRIWSRSVDGLTLNTDIDNPSPGFRGVDFGFLQWSVANSDWILTSANGSKSELKNVSGTTLYQSQDSTYIQLDTSTNTLVYKDGTQTFYEQFGPGPFSSASPLRPTKIENTNGNFISISYTNTTNLSLNTITDTLGRIVNFGYDPSGRLTAITQGARIITFGWNTSYVLNYNFSLPVIASPASGSVRSVLSSVTFPDQTSVNFSYGDWGIVNRIERRSSNGTMRASISCNLPSASSSALSDVPAFTQQSMFDGTQTSPWKYSATANSSGFVTSSSVTDPNGTTTTTTFSAAGDWKDGLPLSEKVTDVNGKVFRTRTKTWISDTGTSAVNPRIASVVTQLDDGTQSAVSYAYDANGNVTDMQETDFGAGKPGPLLRETVTTYAVLGNHILNRPSQIIVKNASSTLSRKDFKYDEYTATPLVGVTPAAPQHDDANYSISLTKARGNLTTQIDYTNAVQASGAINNILSYDVLGNRISAQQGCCTQAHSQYSASTAYAYPDAVITGPPGNALTTGFIYNFGSGTIQTTTNPNGQVTAYGYDLNNRVTSTRTPDGVIKTTVYDDASATPGWTNSTTADSRVTSVTTDFYGHELTNNLLNGNTLVSTISSSYDSLGRVTQTSNPYGPGEIPVYTTYLYDALGRTVQHRPPALSASVDQSSYTTTYTGHSAVFTDPTGRQREELHDALGRLVEVDEPGDPSDGVAASTTINIGGPGIQSKTLSIPAKPGTGSMTITGKEQSIVIPPPTQPCSVKQHCITPAATGTLLPDSGNVSVTINGHTDSVQFGSLSTAASLAQTLADTIRKNSPYADYTSVATNATNPPSATINLVAKTGGTNTDYPLSASFTYDQGDFVAPSFTTGASGASLTGGIDAPRTGIVVVDSGTVTVKVGTVTAQAPYSNSGNNTPALLASALANALNTQSPPFHATASSSGILVTWNSVGQAVNGTVVSGSSLWDSADFTSPSFNAAGANLSQGADPYPSGIAHPYATQYSYDGLGNLLQVNQGQQQRIFAYDSLSHMTSLKIPEKANQAVTMAYTDFGAISSRTDARGIVTNYGYDPLGHLTSIHYSDGTPAVSYSFGAAGAANFSAGLLVKTTDGAGSESYEYDAMGRETKCTRIIGANTYVTSYSYTPDGRIASITYPSGKVVTNSYDDIGRLSSVGTGGTSLFNVNAYNASGQTLNSLYGNGIQASYGYNNQQQVASILIGSGSATNLGGVSPILSLSYDWGGTSDDGLLTGVTDNVNSARSTQYTYDQLKRLATAQTVDLTSPNTWRLQFAYDRYGNRLSQTPTGGTSTMPPNSVTVDATTNRIATATYDSDGNMTNDGINNYIFDAENRITHVNGAANTYAYDGSGLRVNRNGDYYIYSGGHVIAEYAAGALATSPRAEYVYARNKRVATLSGGATTYPYWDHLSVRANADSSGTVVRTFGHFPFGETWYETGVHDKWDYTTYENDSESGLNYAMARFHNPRLGRFMSLDPWPADRRHPQSWNRYSHGNNNPVSFSDPTGMEGCDDDGGGCDLGVDPNDPEELQGGDGSTGSGDEGEGNDDGKGCPPGHACLPDQPPQCIPSGDGDCGADLIPPVSYEDEPVSASSTNTDPSENNGSSADDNNGDQQQQSDQQQQPEQQQKPDDKSDHSCSDAVIETTIGGAAILGDVALAWIVFPVLAEYGGEEAIDAIGHGGTSALIAGVPGVLLYVNGIQNMTNHCN